MRTCLLLLTAYAFVVPFCVAANCNILLNTDERTKACFASPEASGEDAFVCDTTASWMHHVGGSLDWYPATPPKGTGVHDYVVYKGNAPCSVNGSCNGCASPAGDVICSVKIDPEDCSVEDGDRLGASFARQNNGASKCMTMLALINRVLVSVYLFVFGIFS